MPRADAQTTIRGFPAMSNAGAVWHEYPDLKSHEFSTPALTNVSRRTYALHSSRGSLAGSSQLSTSRSASTNGTLTTTGARSGSSVGDGGIDRQAASAATTTMLMTPATVRRQTEVQGEKCLNGVMRAV